MIYEINKIDSRKLPLKSLQPKSKAGRSHPWLFQSLSKPQVYLVTLCFMDTNIYTKKIVCSHCIHKERSYYNCIKKLPIKKHLNTKEQKKIV